MDSFPLPNTIHVNPATQEEEEDEDGKTDGKPHGKEEDDAVPPDHTKITEVVLGKGSIEEEPEEKNVPASTLLVRQLAIIKEPLDAAMAELAASIDGLDTADTPRDGGGGEGGGGGGGLEKTGEGQQPVSMSMMPTSDFEEEWRSESEDGDGSDQILQVASTAPLLPIFTFPRSLSPLKVSSRR